MKEAETRALNGEEKKKDEALEGVVPDLVESMYDVVLLSAVTILCGHTIGTHRQDRIAKLQKLMRVTDIENLLKSNPLQAMFPSFPPLKKAREAPFIEFRSLMDEILDDYVESHKDILKLTGKDRDEYENADFCEAVIRDLWDPETSSLDRRAFHGVIHNIVFAAVSNQFVVTTLYLMYISKNSQELNKVLEELGPLMDYLRTSGLFSTLDDNKNGYSNKTDDNKNAACDRIPMSLLDNMPNLEAGVFETIRLNATSFAPRVTTDQVHFSDDVAVIPKGATVYLLFSILHENPEVYRDPARWDPSRFLVKKEEEEGHSEGSGFKVITPQTSWTFTGFGAGRHPCTGMKLAMLQIKVLCALVLMRWEVEFPKMKDMDKMTTMVVGLARPPAGGSYMRFRRRIL
ncbi:hypothetical protein HDV05_007944 [Chytridiales sp. JEL 0842]|nr:hypothetical protein HDV05_007944 [Chytridiales sp. JEL 0842]